MTKDRWLALPIFASLGIPLALATLWSFVSTTSYSGNILFLFSFFVWLLYFLCGVTALCVGMVFLTKRSWRSASSCSLLPMAVVALTLHEPFWFFICFWVPSYVHFAMLSPNTVQLGRFPECRAALIKPFPHHRRTPNGVN